MAAGQPFRMWRMYVVLPDSNLITVMWNRSDSTEYVHAYLEAKVGIPIGAQVLQWSGSPSPLAPQRTLYDYNIRDEAVVMLNVSLPATTFHIFVKTPAQDKTILLEVTSCNKVTDVKILIAVKTAIPASEQRLMCLLHQLADDRTLGDYDIMDTPT